MAAGSFIIAPSPLFKTRQEMLTSELFDVRGYSVIVTGGASGIGLAYAEVLAANGADVALLDLDADRVRRQTARLRGLGYRVDGKVLDVTDRAALDTAFEEIATRHSRLDVVFANAGVDSGPGYLGAWVGSERPRLAEGAIENYTDARWNRVIEVNLNSVFATIRAAARHMKPRHAGRIIVTSSQAARRCEPAIGMAYMAAKAAVEHLVRNAALELATYNITVNAIAPGMFATNIGGGHLLDPAAQCEVGKVIPMHRVGFPADMYGLALFLSSTASAYVTGQCIGIDGGFGLGTAD
jgi:NAD(P)-dependent dehydrogenase (short-subunit alcohol dehydrogenase family)